MFIVMPTGERFRVLLKEEQCVWVISCEGKELPFCIYAEELETAKRIAAPQDYADSLTEQRTAAAEKRYQLIRPAVEDARCIRDADFRSALFKSIAEENNTTARRVRNLYCAYLATGCLVKKKPRERVVKAEFDDAIRKYYFTAKRNSLRTAYELMILERYTNTNAELVETVPSWDSFRQYYNRYWSRTSQKKIARDGLSNYQRNERVLYGSAMAYRENIGSYQIDETVGDVYLVSKYDRSRVIGRPNVYLAIDTCTQLIAGVYVGLDAGENAVLACIANAVSDKVFYCASLGIDIEKEDWPCSGMPSELITDKGGEFTGTRIAELCIRYGVEINTLPPFRAEEKPLVERAMGLVQDSYKSMLQGKGAIGTDAVERWAVDYRQQAILTLEEYTAIVVHCIISLNRGRVLTSLGHLPVDAPSTPAALWQWFCEQGRSSLLDVDERDVYLRSLPRATGKVTRRGIIFNRMRYLPAKGMESYVGIQVEFAYDVQNTDCIYVLDRAKQLIPYYLAPSNARYSGLDAMDVALIQAAERESEQMMERAELESRVKMRSEILQIVTYAEAQKARNKDISDIAQNRARERSRLL